MIPHYFGQRSKEDSKTSLSIDILTFNPPHPRPVQHHADPRVPHPVLIDDEQGSGNNSYDQHHFEMHVERQLGRNPLRAVNQQ